MLSSVFGAGALVGARSRPRRGRASLRVMLIGAALFTGAELLISPVRQPVLAGALLFIVGAGFTAWSANSNTLMQLAAPDHLRGRIIGLYFYAFNGSASVAGLMVGWLCAKGGTELAFFVAGVVGLAADRARRGRVRRSCVGVAASAPTAHFPTLIVTCV